jgi:hypothetical protein
MVVTADLDSFDGGLTKLRDGGPVVARSVPTGDLRTILAGEPVPRDRTAELR